MRRFVLLGCAAGFVISCANTAPAEEKISLVGAWQRCEPVNGCSKFAFFPNGRVIEQYRVGGRTVTAYGRYHIRGTVLKIGWHRFEPAEICGAGADTIADAERKCTWSSQGDIKGPFFFEEPNMLIWSAAGMAPLQLVRIEL